ncbi:MAG: glycosyltransferase [bacterium]|nr:glycosyltransferase [bacterium]
MSNAPKISVIMPVFHCGRYLSLAIESILQQTFTDFELLVVTESDGDPEDFKTIASFADPRLRHLQHHEGHGIVPSLNTGIKAAQGQYIARMDGDDISLPNRFEKQVQFLEQHPDIGAVGTQAQKINEHGEKLDLLALPTTHHLIAWTMAFKNPMAHPSVMIRKEVLQKETYTTEFLSEDYWLWARLIKQIRFANLAESYLLYRFYPQSTTVRLSSETQQSSFLIRKRYWQSFLSLSDEEFTNLDQALKGKADRIGTFLRALKNLQKFRKSFMDHSHPTPPDSSIINRDYRQKIKTSTRWFIKKKLF